ncbi:MULTISPECIES: putative bifunctional diguanylate cyclase/phosphodiesterase [unclassified Marinobacter]|uniref:putative bifunctional diguanylate cyclase/phosphodiesterase n=1 Tax=unclassified Marinobacter TaxID=83889 RepID=UPI001268F8AF|nr:MULTISPECIES: GGDEF and EAL domain-containing protein [unclassified Marinobacter]QFS85451.1 Cyclic di-GMP phosphodiesterase Gmr [Marinobacter sp. THAF197a]QFT49245.1 Cyclic di-GMP phosphodiesterase Gmr [Marinobacter sp. THAF39]
MSNAPDSNNMSPDIDSKRLALVASATRNLVLILDAGGRIEWVNTAFERHTGFHLDAIAGKNPGDFLHGPDTDTETVRRIRQHLFRGEVFEEDILNYTADGTPYWVHTYCMPVGESEGVEPGFVVIQTNISDRKNSERGLRIAASVFDRSHEAIVITDHFNRIIDVNPAFSRITGYSRPEVLGLNPSILSSGRHSREYYQSMWTSIEKTDHWRGEIWNRRKNGEEYAELLSISRVHLEEPGRCYYVAAFSDITALKNHAKELDRAANYDDLTGLPNRQLLEERIRSARTHADRQKRVLSICYLDLDGFKAINDQLGHDIGNQALRATAERLTGNLRSGDTIARIGGDEFVLLLQSDSPEPVYSRILASVSEPLQIGGHTVNLTASLGVTLYPEDDTDAEGLIRHADQAMYAAKEKGRNQFHIFDPGLDAHRRQRRNRLMEIARALECEEFELYFQPQVRLADNEVTGIEALIRWNHPDKGLVAPSEFLPAVANSHLEIPLGQWVLKEAIHQMNLWHEADESLAVSINISAPHLMDRSFADYLESYLHSHPDVRPGQITLEVLESTALEDTKRASNVLARCQSLGLQVALDDFGTGFSSLTYLRTLPVDVIKIDQSFVRNMLTDASDRAIVESVIFLAQRFDHPVLAEGVETMEHARALRDMGCNLIQGYGVARPMPAKAVLPWLAQWRNQVRHHRSLVKHEETSVLGGGI